MLLIYEDVWNGVEGRRVVVWVLLVVKSTSWRVPRGGLATTGNAGDLDRCRNGGDSNNFAIASIVVDAVLERAIILKPNEAATSGDGVFSSAAICEHETSENEYRNSLSYRDYQPLRLRHV